MLHCGAPPLGIVTTVRVHVCVPTPHAALHGSAAAQSDSVQGTGTQVGGASAGSKAVPSADSEAYGTVCSVLQGRHAISGSASHGKPSPLGGAVMVRTAVCDPSVGYAASHAGTLHAPHALHVLSAQSRGTAQPPAAVAHTESSSEGGTAQNGTPPSSSAAAAAGSGRPAHRR